MADAAEADRASTIRRALGIALAGTHVGQHAR
jgi:hypothetical protein